MTIKAGVTTEFKAIRGTLLSNQRPKKATRPGLSGFGITAGRLDRLADVRTRVVARGKLLVADPNYPSKKVLRGVARVLARNWQS